MDTSPFLLDVEEHLASHIQHYEAAGHSPATTDARRDVVMRARWEIGVPLAEATTQQLAGWLATPGWKKATRSIYRYHLRAYLQWLHNMGHSDRDPSRDLARVRLPRRLPKPVPDTVLAQILAAAQRPYLTYFEFGTYAGLRCAEVAGLLREDITEEEITVLGKGGKVRLVPTHPVIWKSVIVLPPGPIAHFAGKAPPGKGGRRMSTACCNYLIRMGYRGISMHRFRHTFATRLLRAGVNIRVVQELLGHSSLASTMIYTEVSSEERRLAVQALPAVAA